MTASAGATSRSAVLLDWLYVRWKVLLAIAIGIVTFVVLFVVVSVADIAVPGAQPATAGAMLAVITASALGIERAIEMFWSLVGQLANGWWPFNKMLTEVNEMEQDVKNRLTAVQTALDSALSKAGGVVDESTRRLAQAQTEMTKLQARIADLEKMAPGNQRVSLVAATVTQGLGMVAQYQPQIDYNLRLVDQSVAGLTDFVASFKENPARRIINIWAGAMIGLVIAFFVRMDVFAAVLGAADTPQGWWPHLGVALTGLIIGLGSNPTHDVISALQEVKKYRASQNQPGPITGETIAAGAAAAPPMEAAVPGGLEALAAAPPAPQAQPAPPVRRFR